MKKPQLQFKIDDKIIRKGFKHQSSQQLLIAFIDYTRNVYIFKEPWVHCGDRYSHLDFEKTHEMFKIAN